MDEQNCKNKFKPTFERASQRMELLCGCRQLWGGVSHYGRARSGFLNTQEVTGRERSTKYLI